MVSKNKGPQFGGICPEGHQLLHSIILRSPRLKALSELPEVVSELPTVEARES